LIEAAGYEVGRIATELEARGLPVGEILGVGTGSASAQAVGLRAAAAGLPIAPVPGHASARGAALQAGLGIGAFASPEELPEPQRCRPVVGDPAHERWYAAQRRRYRELGPVLAPFSHALSTTGKEPE
jgi:xylulokinase